MESNINETKTIETKESTTTFVEDGVAVEVDYNSAKITNAVPVRDQALRDFMAKPLRVWSGSWSTTDVQNTDLILASGSATKIDIATTLTAQTYWANKIQGFQLLRGTAVLRLVINANPFQAGKLLMHFLPNYANIAPIDASYGYMHNVTLAAKRMQPCVELDCRDAVAILKIPYVAPTYWYDVKSLQYDWGSVWVSVLAPLKVGGAGETTVDYTLYLSFEDFELGAPLVPQSNKKFSATTSKEAVGLSEGPLTKGLGIASTIAGALGSVPTLGPLMTSVSWVARQAQGVASAFGWSKPMNESAQVAVTRQFNRYSATSSGADSSVPLALFADNQLKITDSGSIFSEDEMSFEFLKRRETVFKTFTWATTDITGTVILSKFAVRPTNCYQSATNTTGAHTATYRQGPPIYYFAQNMFLQWRGGLEIIFKFAKTDFHTGRLQVTFTPSSAASSTTMDLNISLLALREIIDLRSGNEFCLRLPYLQNRDYLTMAENSGYLDVLVLNELRAPETCTDTVNVLMYARGAEDFEVQVPGPINYPVYSPQMNPNFTSGNDAVICETIGNYGETGPSLEHAELCVGESFTSIKQMLARYVQTFYNSFTGASTVSASQFHAWPWWRSATYLKSTGLSGPIASADTYAMVGPMYAYYRGGVRVQFTPFQSAAPTVPNPTWTVGLANGLLIIGTSAVFTFSGTLLESFYHTALSAIPVNWWDMTLVTGAYVATLFTSGINCQESSTGSIAAVVPYYSRYRMSFGMSQTTDDKIPNTTTSPDINLVVTTPNGAVMNGGVLARSFTDDFQLMYFIGCPPVFISTT